LNIDNFPQQHGQHPKGENRDEVLSSESNLLKKLSNPIITQAGQPPSPTFQYEEM
jgi:hypothetical protein